MLQANSRRDIAYEGGVIAAYQFTWIGATRKRSTTTGTLTTNVEHTLTWDGTEEAGAYIDGGDNTKLIYVAEHVGKLHAVWAYFEWQSGTDATMRLGHVLKNGTEIIARWGRSAPGNSLACPLMFYTELVLDTNDYFQVIAEQRSGADLTIGTDARFGIELLEL